LVFNVSFIVYSICQGGVQLKQGGAHLKQKKLQQLHYLNTAQANAQVNNIFNSISSSDHGANNGMLQKRAQVSPCSNTCPVLLLTHADADGVV
jgi:hypothetical protein